MLPGVCSRESFNALTNWLTDARTLASPDIVIVLVGNKKDLDVSVDLRKKRGGCFAWCVRVCVFKSTTGLMCAISTLLCQQADREVTFMEASRFAQENGAASLHCCRLRQTKGAREGVGEELARQSMCLCVYVCVCVYPFHTTPTHTRALLLPHPQCWQS